MYQVRSLNRVVVLQFVSVILPVALVLGYQTIADIGRARSLEAAFDQLSNIDEARAAWRTFVNGAADAVDTGSLGAKSLDGLERAKDSLARLAARSHDADVAAATHGVAEIAAAVSHDASLASLNRLRATIGETDRMTAAAAERLGAVAKNTVAQGVTSSRTQQFAVTAALVVTLLVTALLVRALVRGLTTPLERAVALARAIARGEIASGGSEVRGPDIGMLLHSLGEMNTSLHDVIGTVKSASQSVTSAASTLSSDASIVTGHAQDQSTIVDETRRVLGSMQGAAAQVLDDARRTAAAAANAKEVALEGDRHMGSNLAAFDRIIATVHDSASTIATLSDAVGQIRAVTRMIRDIAEQTNLLALNAAIEAARAGEQGRGFAVVADEVRKLAERTSHSTTEINRMVAKVDEETHRAVEAMGQVEREVETGASYSRATGQNLRQIVDAAREVADTAERIAASAADQATAGEASADAVGRIAAIAERTAVSSDRVRVAAGALSDTAGNLGELVGRFRLV